MSSGSKNRKGGKTARPLSKKSSNQNSACYDGVYGNPRMVHALLSLMGTKCNAQVKNGGMYSGIFHTFSQNMDLVIGAASKQENVTSSVNDVDPASPRNGQLMEELIFNAKDIVVVKFRDVKLDFAEVAVKSNGDVGLESRFPSSNGAEPKSLEPWDGGGDIPTDGAMSITGLEDGLDSTTNGTNGWGAEDMFRINKEQYGVKSSYDPALPEYTTPLDNDNSHEAEARKARATRIAQEIESSPAYVKNIDLELDDTTTEEEKFSSVRRDVPPRDQNKFSNRNKGRGRDQNRDQGRELRGQRPNHNYYQGPGPIQRGSYGPGPGRSNTPTNPSESPTSPSQAKPFNRPSGMQSQLPPRFSKGSTGYSREGDRSYQRDDERANRVHESRLHENTTHHISYSSQSKSQRQGGQPRSNYPRNHPPMQPQDYNQTAESANSFSGQSTPQSLSRNSSASSVNQQMTSHWNNKSSPVTSEERHPPPGGMSAPPSGGNPPLTRNFSTGSNRDGDRSKSTQHKSQTCGISKILGRPRQLSGKSAGNPGCCSRPGNSYSSVLQNNSNPKPAHSGGQPSSGPYPDRSYVPLAPGYRPTMPTTGGPQSAQGTRLIFSPKGHSPPSPAMGANRVPPMMVAQTNPIPPRPMMAMQQRYPSSTSAVSSTASTAAPTVPTQSSRKLSSEAKATGLSKTSMTAASHTPSPTVGILKSSSTGSSKTNLKKELTDFSKNFKLADTNQSTGDPSKSQAPPPQMKPPATAASSAEVPPPSKASPASMSKTSRSGSAGQVTPQPVAPVSKEPVSSQQMAPPVMQQSQAMHHAPVSVVRNQSVEGMEIPQPGRVLIVPGGAMPAQALLQPQPLMPIPPVSMWQLQEPQAQVVQTTSVPPQPSINVPSPLATTTASDVVTISAAKGPYVSPQTDMTSQQTAPTQNAPTPAATTSTTPAAASSSAPTPSDAPTEAASLPEDKKQLDPNAKEFTPRSFTAKSGGGGVTPQSSTPAPPPHQPGSGTYYSNPGQVIAPTATPAIPVQYVKTQVPKQEGPVVGVAPHVAPHIHPTTAGHAFVAQGHAYHPHAFQAPLVFAPAQGAHQQMATPGQHAVMPPQMPYQNAESVVYSPHNQQLVQSATPRALQAGYTTEPPLFANFQSSQVQLQQQQPPQQHHQQQPQQQQAQQPQQQSNASYMQQQQQQQQRPHSAHTPSPAHIPPTSPATNVQAQSGTNMAATPSAQIHPPAQNAVMGSHQNYYHQPILAHPSMHGHIIPSTLHGSYPTMQPRNPPTYMVLSNGAQQMSSNPNPPSQHGYMQPVAAASSATVQQQYPGRHQYQNHPHPPQMVQGYQQPPAAN